MPTTSPRPLSRIFVALFLSSLLWLQAAPAALAQGGEETPPTQAPANPVSDKEYVLRFGDALNVYVLENENLEVDEEPLRPDGRISLPLIGDLQASGLTLPQLHDRITKSYSRYFVEPHVVVNVARFRPLNISVVGFVVHAGTFSVPEPLHLLQAIGLAGGVDPERGDLHRVLVVRGAAGTHQAIDLQEVMQGNMQDNVVLYDGDTVTVLEDSTANMLRFLPTVASTISILASAALIYFYTKK